MELKCMGVQILEDLCQIWVWHTFLYIQVSSQNKHGTLLEVVQELTGMELTISKAYITCDGGWFIDGELPLLLLNHHLLIIILLLKISTINQSKTHILYFLPSCIIFCAVFHVTDEQGQKICDEKLIGNIQKVSTDFNAFFHSLHWHQECGCTVATSLYILMTVKSLYAGTYHAEEKMYSWVSEVSRAMCEHTIHRRAHSHRAHWNGQARFTLRGFGCLDRDELSSECCRSMDP